jgi:predicted dienelactone hydrolase
MLARVAAFLFVAVVLLVAPFVLVARPSVMVFSADGTRVFAWLPPEHVERGPVVFLSHGFRGCGFESADLAWALASAGYAVFAPDHADSACETLPRALALTEVSFHAPERWTERTYRARARDLMRLADLLPEDPRFRDLDWANLGLAGYSLGGYTALGLAGGWPSWKDGRVRAVLALSPYTPPFILKCTLGNIDVPVMYQGGTRDMIAPGIHRAAYNQTRSQKFYVELAGADHFAWTFVHTAHNAAIQANAIAFFDTFLRKSRTYTPQEPRALLQDAVITGACPLPLPDSART